MLPTPASRAGGRSGPASRFVLAGLLAAVLIAGMLAMHCVPANAMAMNDAGTHPSATAHPGAAHLGAAQQAAAVSLEPGPAGTACASCPPNHLMAAGCMVSTHPSSPSLFQPAVVAGSRSAPVRAGPEAPASTAIRPRAPSLHLLCISRT